jgi:hypothetical protein
VSTHYYRYASGAYGEQTVTGYAEPPETPEGAVRISEQAYAAGVAAVESVNAAYVEDLNKAVREVADADYQALLAAGIPEATARRLTGQGDPLPLPAPPPVPDLGDME